MQRWRAFCEAANLTALGIWLGTVIMAGAAAGVLFPTMKNDVKPVLPAYGAYDQGEHWVIAGGYIGERVFLVADIVQFICGFIAIATIIPLFAILTDQRVARKHPPLMLRCLGITLAATGFIASLTMLSPRMNSALVQFREAAKAGDVALAETHRAVFDSGHHWATLLMAGTVLCLLLALICGAVSAVTTPTSPGRAKDGALT